jgi:Zn-dependent M28 family amino/carboxypeptidase
VGRVRGRGTTEHPELADEVIVVSAHFDHIGVDSDAEPAADAIHNGADDDASGTAAVLEIAAALAAGEPPARTVVFLLATGEEVGLLGTEAYLDAPAEPLERTVLNLNFEMIGRPDALVGGSGRLWLTGYELSNLGPALAEAGLAIAPDGRPEQNFFRRSDNYAFVRRGVVGQTLSTYDLHEDYHHPSDEANTLDYQHMEQCVRSAFQAVRLVASGALTPAWVEGADPASR